MAERAQASFGISERRACRLVGQPRATQRYESVRDDQAGPRSWIREIAGVHVTWGFQRICLKLRREGWRVNRKRAYRPEGLGVGRHKPRRHRSVTTRPERTRATRAGRWISCRISCSPMNWGRRSRLLTLVDDFSRGSLAIELDGRLTGKRVASILDRVATSKGLPGKIRIDNGSEFTGRALDQWTYANKVRLDFSRPGKPTDNGLIEAFNGRLRAECLNEHWLLSLDDARAKVESWRVHYHEDRPHSAGGNLSPMEVALSKAQGDPAG
jgi:putative transposase